MMRIFLTFSVFSLIGMTASAQYASDWNPDSDGDNAIGVNDLMAFLGVFGTTTFGNGASNEPDCGPTQCGGQSTVTFDGYTYELVGIGSQCWFKENLRSDNYRNGDAIPGNLSDSLWAWPWPATGAQAIYGEGTSAVYDGSSDEVANLATYGRLYNWYAVHDPRGLCPTGFHVPTDGEWMTLEMALGMTSAQANATGWRGTDQGTQLKASSSDIPVWNGTNSSGFSALPGGQRSEYSADQDQGSFWFSGWFGIWWTYTSNLNPVNWYYSEVHSRTLMSSEDGIGRWDMTFDYGYITGCSVRCLKD